jgi:hypothetical protein
MNPIWQEFLAGRALAADGESFGALADELTAAKSGTVLVPLLDQALIRAGGEDAAAFLHNLLTNDIQELAPDGLRFAGFCTPKGRLLASFLVWREATDLLLMVSADIQAAMLKKLSMYILRSKVKLADGGDTVLLGLAGADAQMLIERLGGHVPSARHSAPVAGGRCLRLGERRYVLALPQESAIAVWPVLASAARPAGLASWRWLEIAAGQPRIVAATQEAFVPQMVNMETPAVAGVIFTKGCYPGQEIVARTQYLGKVKRRMYRAALADAALAGTDVFTPEAGDQHCGALVSVAPSPNGGYECLVVVQSSGAQAGVVHLGSPAGPRLTLLEQPYAID